MNHFNIYYYKALKIKEMQSSNGQEFWPNLPQVRANYEWVYSKRHTQEMEMVASRSYKVVGITAKKFSKE